MAEDSNQVKIAPTRLIAYRIDCDGGYSEVNTTISPDLQKRYDETLAAYSNVQLELSEIYHSTRNQR
jgi:hypothetical protein